MRVVYIAGKFRGATPWQVEQNVRAAEAAALEVMRRGHMALCPHKNTQHFDGELPDEFFLEGTKELLRRCDAVLLVPGWQDSVGACGEVVEALERVGIPVFGGGSILVGRDAEGRERVAVSFPESLERALDRLDAWARTAPPRSSDVDAAIVRDAPNRRDDRQATVAAWVRDVFGEALLSDRVERGLRVLEEAAELAQAMGVDADVADRVTARVYSRPVGDAAKELGAVRVTLLAAAECLGVSADRAEHDEVERLIVRDPELSRRSHERKVDARIARPLGQARPPAVSVSGVEVCPGPDERLAVPASRPVYPENLLTLPLPFELELPDGARVEGHATVSEPAPRLFVFRVWPKGHVGHGASHRCVVTIKPDAPELAELRRYAIDPDQLDVAEANRYLAGIARVSVRVGELRSGDLAHDPKPESWALPWVYRLGDSYAWASGSDGAAVKGRLPRNWPPRAEYDGSADVELVRVGLPDCAAVAAAIREEVARG